LYHYAHSRLLPTEKANMWKGVEKTIYPLGLVRTWVLLQYWHITYWQFNWLESFKKPTKLVGS